MIRVQGPQLDQYYYKPKPSKNYFVEFSIDQQPIVTYKLDHLPNLNDLWAEEMAQHYPQVRLFNINSSI